MIAWLNHWLVTDWWIPSWPNIFAPSAPTLLGVLWGHLRLKAHVTAHSTTHCPGCHCAGEPT
ncbi:hypothetical protein [Streptacidiphilus sp. EB103A]|uniref:hypothetical protein n=1 Tax=Streptacidiphilus sp. EB103A TaxID=3156275 RepID=UPI003510FC8B